MVCCDLSIFSIPVFDLINSFMPGGLLVKCHMDLLYCMFIDQVIELVNMIYLKMMFKLKKTSEKLSKENCGFGDGQLFLSDIF